MKSLIDLDPRLRGDDNLKKLNLKNSITVALKGFCIGCADVIPGVSGGTMAFILGIYERLLSAIKSFDVEFVKLLFSLKIKEAFARTDWKFLATLVAGILIAILSLAKILSFLLENHEIQVFSFFFGLIVASVVVIMKHIKIWSVPKWIAVLVSAVVAYVLVGLVPLETPNDWWFLILSGAIAISAMILPGISGSFILILLGKYHFILDAVHERDLVSISFVGIGVVMGVLSFVRVVSWLFQKYHDITIAVLTGLMLGSLRKIWPWKETTKWMTDSHGELVPLLQNNILPTTFDIGFYLAVMLGVAAFFIGFGLEWIAGDKNGIK